MVFVWLFKQLNSFCGYILRHHHSWKVWPQDIRTSSMRTTTSRLHQCPLRIPGVPCPWHEFRDIHSTQGVLDIDWWRELPITDCFFSRRRAGNKKKLWHFLGKIWSKNTHLYWLLPNPFVIVVGACGMFIWYMILQRRSASWKVITLW